jgi:hypothetical protein
MFSAAANIAPLSGGHDQMGMHHGVIAAKVQPAQLIDALNAHVSTLKPSTPATRLDGLPLDATDTGWGLAYGEYSGATYIFDTSLVLSADFDLIASLSRELNTDVVGWGAETVSGTYWFIACRGGELVRGYWHCHMDMREPWTRGTRLAIEKAQAFDADLDGDALAAGAREFGFDFNNWIAKGPFTGLAYEANTFPTPGPLGEEFNRFHASVMIPEGKRPKISVVTRSAGAPGDATPKPRGLRGLFRR